MADYCSTASILLQNYRAICFNLLFYLCIYHHVKSKLLDQIPTNPSVNFFILPYNNCMQNMVVLGHAFPPIIYHSSLGDSLYNVHTHKNGIITSGHSFPCAKILPVQLQPIGYRERSRSALTQLQAFWQVQHLVFILHSPLGPQLSTSLGPVNRIANSLTFSSWVVSWVGIPQVYSQLTSYN